MPTQFFDRAVYYGILAYDNAGPQGSARSGCVRARGTKTGAINSLMARIVNDGESIREDVPPADPVLRPLMASHGTSGDDQKNDVVDASLHADFRRGFFTV